MLQGLAEDEVEWNRTMGTTRDYFLIPHYEESGLLCASFYFYNMYIVEWYYDYIGYDYYHEDFNFYYYDGYSGSGSGSASGDYYDYYGDYSGSGSGDNYLGSGSGKKLIRIENILVVILRIWDEW